MADWHHGYGFPIGGVVATQVEWGDLGGSISPGGVGFDINCGVRALALDITKDDIEKISPDFLEGSKGRIPAGASGKGGVDIGDQDLDRLVSEGAKAAAELGYGLDEDLAHIESKGQLETDGILSTRAKQRGLKALGTLGSGNHFLELQIVENVTKEAKDLDLFEGQIVAMIHSGSRGLGHQVCTDRCALERTYKQKSNRFYNEEWDFTIADRQLAAAPVHSPEGEAYLDAMNGAANFAFANRSALTQRLRDGLKAELWKRWEARVLYDIGHNLAKKETHIVHGESCQCWVHQKAATKAEPGQTVLVPGDMGTASYIMKGLAGNRAFQSSCHGAGRCSRTKAKRSIDGKALAEELAQKGVHVQANSIETLAEEAPDAYKNVDEVIAKTQAAGLAKPIARVKPMIVVKG